MASRAVGISEVDDLSASKDDLRPETAHRNPERGRKQGGFIRGDSGEFIPGERAPLLFERFGSIVRYFLPVRARFNVRSIP